MRVLSSYCLLLLLGWLQGISGGNIFLWVSYGSKSHLVVWKPLALALASRGHSLTFVTPFEDAAMQANENITLIVVPQRDMNVVMDVSVAFKGSNPMEPLKFLVYALEVMEKSYQDAAVQKLIKAKPKFDVSIVSSMNVDLGIYLAKKHFDSPVILYNPNLRNPVMDWSMGNPMDPSYIPVEMFDFGQSMSFVQRVKNTLAVIGFPLLSYYMVSQMNSKIQEVMQLDEAPSLGELYLNADFAFMNSHPIFDDVRPVNPNTARIGGIHLKPAKPLEGELKQWLDGARDGAILISFGSVLRSSELPKEKRDLFINTFSKLKQRVIWKWETEDMEGKPDNVMIKKWLPQQDILGHPNVKLFITHGGLMSTEESVYYGVPILVMPGFADQFSNGARAQRHGYGSVVQWADLEANHFLTTLNSLLNNDTVQKTADYYGMLLRDNVASSLDTAVFYTEYIMRHKGAPHLRSPAKDLYWFQYFLLDVILFVAVIIFLTLFITVKVTVVLIRSVCCKTNAGKVKLN